MSYVVAVPEFVAFAASDLAGIRSAVNAAHAAAAAPTTGVVAAAGDEVSAAIASLFPGTGRPSRRSAPGRRHFMTSSCRH